MEQNHIHEHTLVADLVALFNIQHRERTGRKDFAFYQLTDIGSAPAKGVEHVLNLHPRATIAVLLHINTALSGMMAKAYEGGEYPPTTTVTCTKHGGDRMIEQCAMVLASYRALEHGNVVEEISVRHSSTVDQFVFLGLPANMLRQLSAIAAFIDDIDRWCAVSPIVTRHFAHFWGEVRSLNNGKRVHGGRAIPESTYKHIDQQRSLKGLLGQLPQLQRS